MPPFPYFEILRKAYELTRKHKWLWVFGLFVGGGAGINYGGINYILPRRGPEEIRQLKDIWQIVLSWIAEHSQEFTILAAGVVVLAVFLILISGVARAALIWATAKFTENPSPSQAVPPVGFKKAVKAGARFVWPIIGLQVLVTVSFFILFLIFALPIAHLFSAGAIGKGIFLSLLGLVIFLPASVVLGFLHLYGPIFIVLYRARISEAINYSFYLIRHELKEILILAAVLIGLSLMFVFVLLFSIILFSLPVALLALFLLKMGMLPAVYALVLGTSLLIVCYTIVLGAGFSIFQNITWILAVMYLVKAQKLPAEKRVLAAEPVV